MIQIESVTQRYGAVTALDSVSLEIRAGGFFGLLGPNGASKTTVMGLLSGFRSATSGRDPDRRRGVLTRQLCRA